MGYETDGENIAQTLAKELPKPELLHTQGFAGEDQAILHLALPNNFKHVQVDNEHLRAHPRFTKASANLTEPDDFLAYVIKHAKASTVVWVDFNPVTYKLSFHAVIDDHEPGQAGWRKHTAAFTPQMSNEWKVWTEKDEKVMSQVDFALFLESQEEDIASVENRPTHLDMMNMALQFEARQDQQLRSTVRLQNGGVEMSYVGNDDAQTIEKMKVFEKFSIGIPVFRGMKDELGKPLGYIIDARLRYRSGQGKATFWYELVRPDKTHENAAQQLIRKIKDGLAEKDITTLLGSST